MKRRRTVNRIVFALIGVLAAWTAWQFRPPPSAPPLPTNYHSEKAVWLGVTWVMDEHTDAEIDALAHDLQSHNITYVFAYMSYLKLGDFFNPTFEHAARFVEQFRATAPEIVMLAWVGVPVQITTPEGAYIDNRLKDSAVRDKIAEFSGRMVSEFGFDGIHLNAEMIVEGDDAFVASLESIRDAMPPDAMLSVAAHALRQIERVTIVPYPALAQHWSTDYLRLVAEHSDQVAVMAYDSGLFFPSDYRSWMAYQVRHSAEALAETDVNLLIGVPVSEEWTLSHNITTEYLTNALYGVRAGLNESGFPEAMDGIAIYPYWEISADEWAVLDEFP